MIYMVNHLRRLGALCTALYIGGCTRALNPKLVHLHWIAKMHLLHLHLGDVDFIRFAEVHAF